MAYNEQDRKTLQAVAFGFALACTIISGFALIPLIWTIPMTIRIYHMYKGDNENDSLAFDILSLIFLSAVSGIILIIDYFIMEDRKESSKVVDAKTIDEDRR